LEFHPFVTLLEIYQLTLGAMWKEDASEVSPLAVATAAYGLLNSLAITGDQKFYYSKKE
jgi:hypothetical protein